MSVIYLTENFINHKIYVGIQEDYIRSYLGSGKWLNRAVKKYRKENFRKDILEEFEWDIVDGLWCEDSHEDRERYWIRFYNAQNPEIGYNIAEGGEGAAGVKMSKANKNKMRKTMKGRSPWNKGKTNVYSKETLQKISNSVKEHNPRYWKGKKRSKDTMIKVSQKLKGRHYGWLRGKHLPEKLKENLRIKNSGVNNPNYGKFGILHQNFGKMWIHNPTIKKSTFIRKNIEIPFGWKLGRK